MRIFMVCLVICLACFNTVLLKAQENYQQKIEALQEEKAAVTREEKKALEQEVESINDRLDRGQLSDEEARELKEAAARKRALNIENRVAILDNRIALLERNKGTEGQEETQFSITDDGSQVRVYFGDGDWFRFDHRHRKPRYDRRTYSDPVFAVGFSNAAIDGQSLNDSPYKLAGSRFFEMGWSWRTRVFQNTNFMRIHYGFSFQFYGLKPDDNQYFVTENNQTFLEDFDYELDKSKFRQDNLVFPVYLEFGPSKLHTYDDHFRYSLHNQFRFGIGGYAGFNMSSRQKLKYVRDGDHVKDKLKGGYNTNDLIYGLSAYVGIDNVQLYFKYDLNPIFKNDSPEQHMIGLGLRIDH